MRKKMGRREGRMRRWMVAAEGIRIRTIGNIQSIMKEGRKEKEAQKELGKN